ncbi:hypothetical protein, partial [Salmonella enterica]|uniref:hypothetical protein n=1 Tax=Salmonella enterica TaxID=28901 RepID=UPI001C378956
GCECRSANLIVSASVTSGAVSPFTAHPGASAALTHHGPGNHAQRVAERRTGRSPGQGLCLAVAWRRERWKGWLCREGDYYG